MIVQQNTGQTNAASTATVSFLNPTKSGNFLVVVVGTQSPTVSTITDSQSNAWTKVDTTTNTATGELWFAPNITGGSNTLTITLSGTSNTVMLIREYAGVYAGAVDVHTKGSGTSTAPTSTATGNPTAPSELVIGYLVFTPASAITSAGAGYYNLLQLAGSSVTAGMADKMITAEDPQTATFTISNSIYVCGVATFVLSRPGFQLNNIRPRAFAPGLAR